MTVYVLPALIAFLVKVAMLMFSHRTFGTSRPLMIMVLIFAIHNLCEVLVFWEFFSGSRAEYVLRAYYVISIVSLAWIAYYGSIVSKQEHLYYKAIVVPIVVAMCGAILFTDYIMAGSRPLGYIATAIRGEYYGLFQIVSLAFTVYMIMLLVSGYRSSGENSVQIRCAYAGLALVPQFAAQFITITLMNMGLPVNAAMFFPIATTLFLLILVMSERKHGLSDIRRFIPFSDERKTSAEIMEIFSKYAQNEEEYRQAINEIEKLLVTHKYEKNNRNASSTAEQMGMPRSSLYSLFNRLDISNPEKEKSQS